MQQLGYHGHLNSFSARVCAIWSRQQSKAYLAKSITPFSSDKQCFDELRASAQAGLMPSQSFSVPKQFSPGSQMLERNAGHRPGEPRFESKHYSAEL
jgi:hypothetical protein